MLIRTKKSRSHKRHFQLLELMVAAFILLVCIAPTMRIFTSMYLSQNDVIRENQRDHLAHMAHGIITEMLYKHQIPMDGNSDSRVIPINDIDLIELLNKFSYTCNATLAVEGYIPRGQEKPTKYLGKIVITMKDVSPGKNKDKDKIPKKIENQDATETFYDYFVYIDSGSIKEKEDKHKKGNPNDKGSNLDKATDKNLLDPKGSASDKLKAGLP